MSESLGDDLWALAREHNMLGKGFLGLALIITERAQKELPLDLNTLMTEGGGQVRGAGGGAVKRILSAYGIERVLSSEGGRTSRGTPAKAKALANFLNERIAPQPELLPLVMEFWLARVRDFFAGKPFVLHIDPAFGVTTIIRGLITQVEKRQSETPGCTIVGTVVQHLVGAKLEVRLDRTAGSIARHGANVNDVSQRGGDLEIGDVAIHVTTAPTTFLIEKCRDNVAKGLRPVVVTSSERTAYAKTMLGDVRLADRADVFDYEQFLAANVFELGAFESNGRLDAFKAIVERYNLIIDTVETDPGLRIEIA